MVDSKYFPAQAVGRRHCSGGARDTVTGGIGRIGGGELGDAREGGWNQVVGAKDAGRIYVRCAGDKRVVLGFRVSVLSRGMKYLKGFSPKRRVD